MEERFYLFQGDPSRKNNFAIVNHAHAYAYELLEWNLAFYMICRIKLLILM